MTDDAKKFIAENGFDPVYGARPLKRYIQKHIETALAKHIIAGKIQPRQTIEIDIENNQIKIDIVY